MSHKRKEPPSSVYKANQAAYTYSEKDGKELTKRQIKRCCVQNQSKATWYNRDLSDTEISEFVIPILVNRGKVELEIAKRLMDAEGIALLKRAFTHWSMDWDYNYEMLEALGDTTYNKAVTYIIRRKFPSLNDDPNGNYKLTEASKLYKSKTKAPIFSDALGLCKMARYVSLIYQPQAETYPDKLNQLVMDNKMKTDLFEAFLAAVEDLIDSKVSQNLGYAITYNIIESLFENIELTIDLSVTKTNKAKLKELLDKLHGTLEYKKRYDNRNDIIGVDLVVRFDGGCKTFCSTGVIKGFDIAADGVSHEALEWLEKEHGKTWLI